VLIFVTCAFVALAIFCDGGEIYLKW